MSESKVIGKPAPGPWHRDKYGRICDKNGEEIVLRSVAVLCSGSPERIAEAEANTNLASSAPDLLEALETIKRRMYEPRQFLLVEVEAIIDQAITRARGLSQ